MAVFQELTQQDWINRVEACQHLIERLPDDAVVFFSDEAHFHISVCVNTLRTGDADLRFYVTTVQDG